MFSNIRLDTYNAETLALNAVYRRGFEKHIRSSVYQSHVGSLVMDEVRDHIAARVALRLSSDSQSYDMQVTYQSDNDDVLALKLCRAHQGTRVYNLTVVVVGTGNIESARHSCPTSCEHKMFWVEDYRLAISLQVNRPLPITWIV